MIIGIDGNEANVKQRVGSNQYAFELLKAISAKRISRACRFAIEHSFVIYLRDEPLPDMPRPGKNCQYRVIKPRKFWTQFRLPLDLYFHKPRPDVFFSPGHYAPRFSPIPVVISIMDLGFLKFPDQFTKKDLYQLTSWTKRSVKSASHILAISQSTKNDIIKTYGVSESKITVTYPGYDTKNFQFPISNFQIKRVKEKYKIAGDYILFLSTLKPSKNIEGLLKAFSLITNHPFGPSSGRGQSPITLVIAGKKGWLYEKIFEKVEELDLGKKVVFTDFVPDEDVPGLMAGAKVFVLPSFWEGFGIPVVEAMACGTPVVVSNTGSLPEVVGQAGIVVDPYQPEDIARGIKEAITKRKELSKKGLERAKDFSWETCAKKTLTVLEEVK